MSGVVCSNERLDVRIDTCGDVGGRTTHVIRVYSDSKCPCRSGKMFSDCCLKLAKRKIWIKKSCSTSLKK